MSDSNYKNLSLNAKKSWFAARFIFLLILLIPIPFILIGVHNKKIQLVVLAILGLFIFLQLLNTFLYPYIEYKQWKYFINDEKVELIHGIYFITTSVIPIVRIQNINLNQGPINRIFKLTDLEIMTAGNNFTIPNIESSEANKLCEFLREKINDAVKEDL
ncbi:PH domain-containing protein [Clostridium oryzae]|uniref:Bacterial membrane flanked domain protein n=1 Tax=Clostridium oryzae TaxID=1450648 RepID=A0A1V4ID95_9CLOT|nr:PH domain-containing protein [Clostridium oryzae]OPJ57834.1 bacterial membrane flanked domain protein [Clostridium oryzae]